MTSDTQVDRGLVLITGATSGLGAAYARVLAARGYDLWLTGRRMQRLDSIADQLRQAHGVAVSTQRAELDRTGDLRALERAVADEPNLIGLINNAGYADDGQFHTMSPGRHHRLMQVHMNATVRLSQAALPVLLERGGWLINVSSLASWLPTPGSPLYGPTKAFVRLFTETLALTYADTEMRFQALCPGFVVTDFHSRMGLDPETFYYRHGPAKAFPAEWVAERSMRDLGRRVVSSPGWHYGFLNRLIRFTPLPLVHYLVRRGMKRRYGAGGSSA